MPNCSDWDRASHRPSLPADTVEPDSVDEGPQGLGLSERLGASILPWQGGDDGSGPQPSPGCRC